MLYEVITKNDEIGRTLSTILYTLEHDLGYKVSWKVFDSLEFGLPQSRKRIFIVGTLNDKIDVITSYSIHYTKLYESMS